jgi:hypothetical protein
MLHKKQLLHYNHKYGAQWWELMQLIASYIGNQGGRMQLIAQEIDISVLENRLFPQKRIAYQFY